MLSNAELGRLIAAFPKLEALAAESSNALMQHALCQTLPVAAEVFQAGDSCEGFLLMLDGVVRVGLRSPRGREITLYRVAAGDTCVLTTSCLLSKDHYPANACVESGATAVVIPRSMFDSLMHTDEHFRQAVFAGFSRRLADVLRRFEGVAFRTLEQQLAGWLLDRDSAAIDVTHQALAQELGSVREVVSRTLRKMQERGAIELSRTQITIVEPSVLRQLFDPDSAAAD